MHARRGGGSVGCRSDVRWAKPVERAERANEAVGENAKQSTRAHEETHLRHRRQQHLEVVPVARKLEEAQDAHCAQRRRRPRPAAPRHAQAAHARVDEKRRRRGGELDDRHDNDEGVEDVHCLVQIRSAAEARHLQDELDDEDRGEDEVDHIEREDLIGVPARRRAGKQKNR